MYDHYLMPLVLCLMAFWMGVAWLAIRETRQLRRRVAELEEREAKGK